MDLKEFVDKYHVIRNLVAKIVPEEYEFEIVSFCSHKDTITVDFDVYYGELRWQYRKFGFDLDPYIFNNVTFTNQFENSIIEKRKEIEQTIKEAIEENE